jgi:predicted acetyltransferase
MMIMNEVEPNIDVSERAIKNYFHACPTALMVLSIHTHTNTYTPFKRFYYTAKKIIIIQKEKRTDIEHHW